MASSRFAVLPNALSIPVIEKLKNKRVVLASKSPRRCQILSTFGLSPEIIPSTFEEDLPAHTFEDIHEYPVATAMHKAVEVYERLVQENPEDGPDLVIGADTIVLTHPPPGATPEAGSLGQDLIEKPADKEDNLRMLLDLNGGICEVVTGVSLVYPVLTAPGYDIKSIDERTLLYFADSPRELLQAYVDSGEGLDCAGGFNIAGNGALLMRKIDGDYHNVVGFPAASFFTLLNMVMEEEEDFLA